MAQADSSRDRVRAVRIFFMWFYSVVLDFRYESAIVRSNGFVNMPNAAKHLILLFIIDGFPAGNISNRQQLCCFITIRFMFY
jgi:hypothetical protein